MLIIAVKYVLIIGSLRNLSTFDTTLVIDLEFAHAKLEFYFKKSIMIIIGEQSSK